MNCEVCFKPTTGRRCAKHPEYYPNTRPFDHTAHLKGDNKAERSNRKMSSKNSQPDNMREDGLATERLICRIEELEALQEPCYYQDAPKNEQVLPKTERPATPTQFQQIKGELNHIINKLNDHIDRSKRKRKSKSSDNL